MWRSYSAASAFADEVTAEFRHACPEYERERGLLTRGPIPGLESNLGWYFVYRAELERPWLHRNLEVYVNWSGTAAATNPLDLLERMEAFRQRVVEEGAPCPKSEDAMTKARAG